MEVVKTDPERVKTSMYVCALITANLTIMLEPFLPFSMEKLRNFLNLGKLPWSELGRTDLLPAGHQVNTPELLFEKIEDEVIEKQVAKLLETKRANEAANAKVTPAKDNISYDEFSKKDIRTGTVLEAELFPKPKN
jgi:methionyl-tRNA synthetase